MLFWSKVHNYNILEHKQGSAEIFLGKAEGKRRNRNFQKCPETSIENAGKEMTYIRHLFKSASEWVSEAASIEPFLLRTSRAAESSTD